MMKKTIKKNTAKKYVYKPIFRQNPKPVDEAIFWKKIALEQQALIHAKNNT
jgi:hypothetical protein